MTVLELNPKHHISFPSFKQYTPTIIYYHTIVQMQIEEHFEVVIKYLYNIKIAVAASPKAKKMITSKNLTPALFMRPFFADISKANFNVIDVQDYRKPNPIQYQQKAYALLSGPLMNQRNMERQQFDANTDIEDHINRQTFLWFLESAKLYLDNTSFEYTTTTIDQPLGIIQILAADDDFGKDYQSISQQTNQLLKDSYFLNPSQVTKIEPLVLILIDKKQNRTIQEALKYTQVLRKDYKINGNLIERLDVNLEQSGDMHSIWLPCVKHSYEYKDQLKPGQKVYFLSPQIHDRIVKSTKEYQELILLQINRRMEYLNKGFKQMSKPATKFFGMFSTSNNSKDKYSSQEQQCRQLGDLSFILGEYKKAYQCYKELVGKFSDRNKKIYYYILEMMNHCLVFSKKYGQWYKNDPYPNFERDCKIILQNSPTFIKQAIFVVYSLYALGVFKKQFIREYFYSRLKAKMREPDCPLIMGTLIHQQIATFHLMYNPSERRNYANNLLKVGILFSDNKLMLNSFHCFRIIQNIYKGTFNVIEIFLYTYLSKMCLENGQFASSVLYLHKGWNSINNRITDERYNQFLKNFEKLITGIEEAKATSFLNQPLLPLRFPNIKGIQMALEDQVCQQRIFIMKTYNFKGPSQSEWTKMGEEIFGSDNISINKYISHFKTLGAFDADSIEKKQMVFKFKSQKQNDKIIQKHTRVCYANQQIKIQFYIHNPLFKEIQLVDCSIVISGKAGQSNSLFTITPNSITTKIKGNTEKMLQFTIVPKQTGIFQLSKFRWHFNRLYNQYELPKLQNNSQRNYYFKFNVQPEVGRLKMHPIMSQSSPFVGMIDKIKVNLTNSGTESIEDIFVVVSDKRLFGFRTKKIQSTIPAGQKIVEEFSIRVYSAEITSIRCLFIYKTNGRTRMKRLIVPFSPTSVAEIKNITCQKLSSHIHLLNFDVEKLQVDKINKSINLIDDKQNNDFKLNQMVLGQGFQILKVESAKSENRVSYTFFLQKNPNAPSQKHMFSNFIQTDPNLYEQFCQADQEHRIKKWQEYQNRSYPYDHHQRMNIIFLFTYEGKLGIFHPQRVSTNPKLLKILDKKTRLQDFLLPFDFKARYPSEISHDFSLNPVLEIDVEFKIKNIFTQKIMDLGVYFLDGDVKVSPNDQLLGGTWEGQTSYRLLLQKDKQTTLKLKFVVFEIGVYDMSKIRYKLFKEGTKTPVTIMHNQFENLFIEVMNNGIIPRSKSASITLPTQQIDLLD